MRGYVSFLVALLCSLILLDLLRLHSESSGFDFSRAVAAERTFGLEMNVKGLAIQSVRAGGTAGFAEYDAAHELDMCIHCPDNACALPTPLNPAPPNRCDDSLCRRCFRESGAREAAVLGSLERLVLLQDHEFDSDFAVSFGNPELESSLKADVLSKNGLRLSSVRFRTAFPFNVSSEKLGASSESAIPGGFSIDFD